MAPVMLKSLSWLEHALVNLATVFSAMVASISNNSLSLVHCKHPIRKRTVLNCYSSKLKYILIHVKSVTSLLFLLKSFWRRKPSKVLFDTIKVTVNPVSDQIKKSNRIKILLKKIKTKHKTLTKAAEILKRL